MHGLPYKRYPRIMTIKLVGNTMRDINQLPVLNRISEHMSPLSIITGQILISYRKFFWVIRADAQKYGQDQHYES